MHSKQTTDGINVTGIHNLTQVREAYPKAALYAPLGLWKSERVAHQVILILSPPPRIDKKQRMFVYDPNHTKTNGALHCLCVYATGGTHNNRHPRRGHHRENGQDIQDDDAQPEI